MRKFIRFTLLIIGSLALIGAIALTLEFTTRGKTAVLQGSNSIASLEKVQLGGVDQWILVRGQDTSKPVLLFLHGGPGMPAMFLEHACQRDLEHDFVVVHWDRRGAGKSFAAVTAGVPISVSQTLEDTYALTRLLRKRFGQNRIYLVGHSWGSYLGLLAIRGHPEYYSAYIGMGQLAGTRTEAKKLRRAFLVREAREAGDHELSASLANPDFEPGESTLFKYGGELHAARNFWPILKTGLFASEYTLQDILNVKKGANLVDGAMQYDVSPKPLEGEIAEFRAPIYFFLGRYDYNTPSQLAARYLNRLDAPLKELVWFEDSAHFPFFEQPERFHQEMLRIDQRTRAFWNRNASLANDPPTGETAGSKPGS